MPGDGRFHRRAVGAIADISISCEVSPKFQRSASGIVQFVGRGLVPAVTSEQSSAFGGPCPLSQSPLMVQLLVGGGERRHEERPDVG
jgi:hypothetical protein